MNDYNSQGAQCYEQGNNEEAFRLYMLALDEEPNNPVIHYNIGNVLYQYCDDKQAGIDAYATALELDQHDELALQAMAKALYYTGDNAGAVRYTDRLLAIKPSTELRIIRAIYSIPDITVRGESLDHLDCALEEWQHNADTITHYIPTLFCIGYRYGDQTERLRKFGAGFAPFSRTKLTTPPKRKRKRIVIVSTTNCESVWLVILQGIMEHIDRALFEVVFIPVVFKESYWSRSAKELADISFDECANEEQVIRVIRELEPDVVFYPEAGMTNSVLRFASMRLDPLQVAAWGHPITTGITAIDIFFSGELLEPANGDEHYTERLVRLPGAGCLMIDHEPIEPVSHNLKPGIVRFLIAQSSFKCHPDDDELYIRIAKEVGVCEFWLPINGKETETLKQRLTLAFESAGLDPNIYLHWFPFQDAAGFNGLLDELDIYLDCPVFSGYTTAYKAIQRGIPIVTLEGEFMRQRLAAGLLRQIGMEYFVADTKERYIENAVTLAKDAVLRDIVRIGTKQGVQYAQNNMEVIRALENELLTGLSLKLQELSRHEHEI